MASVLGMVEEDGDAKQTPPRKGSLKKMREAVMDTFKVKVKSVDGKWQQKSTKTTLNLGKEFGKNAQKKKSLSHWRNYQTISWRVDEERDHSLGVEYSKTDKNVPKYWTVFKRAWHWLVSWVVPGLIGVSTAISGHYIERAVGYFNALRSGHCSTVYLDPKECETPAYWVWWGDQSDNLVSSIQWDNLSGPLFYVLMSTALATVSAVLVTFAPMARGSGIPEVKTILGGFCMNEALEFKTLVVKIIGLILSVSSGLSLGKEGPLVHVACCWSHLLSRISTRYSINESKRRELLSTAAAAGVSVAFGAPLGGVLFSFEEVSTMFPTKTMLRAFFAASIAALTLGLLGAKQSLHPGKLTMFETHYSEAPHYTEYPAFLMLGIIGGLVGSLFVHWNIMISANRTDGSRWRRLVPIVLEVALIALVTGVTSYPIRFTREMSSETIRALFHSCNDRSRPNNSTDMMGLCVGEGSTSTPSTEFDVMYLLLLSGLIRFLQMTMTFGTGVPCGLFVPSLFTGACIGRVFGMLMRRFHPFTTDINPGVYSMLGAAAVLGGVCRVTISLVVIMFELTGGLQMIVPFMLAVLTAKQVGDQFTGGIYDCCIKLRGYPYLHEPDDITFSARACDIMDADLDCLTPELGTMDELLSALEDTKFAGLPLVRSEEDPQLIGFVFKKNLIEWIKKEKEDNAFVSGETLVAFKEWCPEGRKTKGTDLSSNVDLAAMRVVPETPLAQVHNIFRQLGVKVLLITKFGKLVGMITKKAYLNELSSGNIGHVTDDPVILNHQARCEAEGVTSQFLSPMPRQKSPEIKQSPSVRLSSSRSSLAFRLHHHPDHADHPNELEEGLLAHELSD